MRIYGRGPRDFKLDSEKNLISDHPQLNGDFIFSVLLKTMMIVGLS
jgi:hypothetical protein